RRPATWVCVTLGLAFSGAVVTVLQSRLIAGFDKSTSLVRNLLCEHEKASIKFVDDKFSMLVSPLQGDTTGAQTDKIMTAFTGQGDVQLVKICQSLQIGVGDEFVTEQINAVDRGQALLKKWHADLILFGKVVIADNSLHIWTVNQHGGCDLSPKP